MAGKFVKDEYKSASKQEKVRHRLTVYGTRLQLQQDQPI